MYNRKNEPDTRTDKEKALEIIPVIVGGIFLVLGLFINNFTLKIVFFALAAAVGVGAYIVALVRELITRKRKKNGKK